MATSVDAIKKRHVGEEPSAARRRLNTNVSHEAVGFDSRQIVSVCAIGCYVGRRHLAALWLAPGDFA